MRLGLMVGYWGLGWARRSAGGRPRGRAAWLHSAWAAEAYGSDAATVLAWLAAGTSTIRLGAGIFQMPGRSPAMTAMTAATIDELSGGRMLLGIGSSGPQVAEGWHGQRFARQLQRTREYVAVVRIALSRERLVFNGETLQLPLPDGPGRALKLTIGRSRSRSRSTWPRSDRATRRWRARSPTAGSDVLLARERRRIPWLLQAGADRAGRRSTASTSLPPSRPSSPMTARPRGI